MGFEEAKSSAEIDSSVERVSVITGSEHQQLLLTDCAGCSLHNPVVALDWWDSASFFCSWLRFCGACVLEFWISAEGNFVPHVWFCFPQGSHLYSADNASLRWMCGSEWHLSASIFYICSRYKLFFIDFFFLLSLHQKDFGIDIWAIFLFFLKVISDLSVLSILYCKAC